jgi:hypothetical protein
MAQIACWWYIIIRLPLTSRNPNSCSHPHPPPQARPPLPLSYRASKEGPKRRAANSSPSPPRPRRGAGGVRSEIPLLQFSFPRIHLLPPRGREEEGRRERRIERWPRRGRGEPWGRPSSTATAAATTQVHPAPLLPFALLMRARAENAKLHFAFFCANGDFPGFGVYARSWGRAHSSWLPWRATSAGSKVYLHPLIPFSSLSPIWQISPQVFSSCMVACLD